MSANRVPEDIISQRPWPVESDTPEQIKDGETPVYPDSLLLVTGSALEGYTVTKRVDHPNGTIQLTLKRPEA